MSERAPLPRVAARPRSGRVLIVAPHADDDVIGPGGTLALHADAGDPVHVLVMFDGRAGDPDGRHEPEDYVRRRRAEARAGGAHLGLSEYTFWDYPEGHEPHDNDIVAASRRFAAFAHGLSPDVVYAPWVGEYHIDHNTAARVVRIGLDLIGFEGEAWGYEVWTPLIPVLIVDISEAYERKVAALAEHKSQFEYHDLARSALALSAQRAMYCRRGATHGEAFAPLGPPTGGDRELAAAIRREDAARRG